MRNLKLLLGNGGTSPKSDGKVRHFESGRGYSMLEMIVVISIVTLVSAVMLYSFTGFNERGALNRAAREMALAIRRAQNISISVTRIQTSSGPVIPPAAGVKLTLGPPPSYVIFADVMLDFKYNAAEDALIDEIFLERGVKIGSLTGFNPGPQGLTTLHVMFTPPEAAISLTNANGSVIGDRAEIELVAPSGQKKTIGIRTSGQVSVK